MNNPTEEKSMSNVVWQSQTLEAPPMSLRYIRHQAGKLNSDIRLELHVASVSTALSAMLCLFIFLRPSFQMSSPFLMATQLSALLLLLASSYVTLRVHRRAKELLTQEHEQAMPSLNAYRLALQRRRNHCFSAWRWSIWPLLPTMAVLITSLLLYDERPGKWSRLGIAILLPAVGSLFGFWVYWRKGTDIQRELDALPTLDEEQPA